MTQLSERSPAAVVAAAFLLATLPACGEKGTLEQAGEEVDEGVATLQRGEESAATRMDDAVDEARAAAKGAAQDIREGAKDVAQDVREGAKDVAQDVRAGAGRAAAEVREETREAERSK
ncbi:MAG: hypothetical protein MUF07_16315 [Steroidobacteraceae bacterium]|jgi:predicted small lipoprotein YifL|nr:hypothetical protein [Steroidobacteraceae bacterium]